MQERLQKIISKHGIASRRQAEKLLEEGRVTVNGIPAFLGQSADDTVDQILVDGALLTAPPEHVYIMLNKPRGYVTTLQDEKGRKNVSELVADCGQRVYPVGRLDFHSEGLLLLTNDGALTQMLTHPRGEVHKVYHVLVDGFYDGAEEKLRQSIVIDGRKTIPAGVKLLSRQRRTALLEFTLYEGRNRQIRRLCEHAGVTVTCLKRVSEGSLQLGDLSVGKWRYLSQAEIDALYNHF